jgi:Fungal Zn(2)-Cys(6) binuclear cluster domain
LYKSTSFTLATTYIHPGTYEPTFSSPYASPYESNQRFSALSGSGLPGITSIIQDSSISQRDTHDFAGYHQAGFAHSTFEATDFEPSPVNSGSSEESAFNVDSGELHEKPSTKRSRTGCQTCRRRHLKCDEDRPTCRHCAKGGLACQWGLVLKYPLKNMHVQRIPNPVPIKKDYKANLGEWKFEDNSVTIASEYDGGIEQYGFHNSEHISLPGISSFNDEIPDGSPHDTANSTSSSFSGSHRTIRIGNQAGHSNGMLSNNESSSLARTQGDDVQRTQQSNSYTTSRSASKFSATQRSRNTGEPNIAYNISPYELYLTKAYISEVANWMDLLNPRRYVSAAKLIENFL